MSGGSANIQNEKREEERGKRARKVNRECARR
jgi:hypothetical protein